MSLPGRAPVAWPSRPFHITTLNGPIDDGIATTVNSDNSHLCETWGQSKNSLKSGVEKPLFADGGHFLTSNSFYSESKYRDGGVLGLGEGI